MPSRPRSLAELHTDQTERLILDASLTVLEENTVAELTVRGVAKRAGISERTIFRYFPTREEFLDAIARAVIAELALPAPPTTRDELLSFPRKLYGQFEAKAHLTRASLHSELFPRIRNSAGGERWIAVRKLVDTLAPRRSSKDRAIAAVNIRFYLSANTWNYYRSYFHLTLEETIACADTAIRQSLDSLRR